MALLPLFLVICGLLAVAGALKLTAPAATRSALRSAGLPAPHIAVRLLGAGELGLGSLAAINPRPLSCGLVAAAYAGFAGFVLGARRAGGSQADCGCFGGGSDLNSSLGTLHLTLNLSATAIAVLAAIWPPPGLGWLTTASPLVAGTVAVSSAAAIFAAYLTYTAVPAAWRAYARGAADEATG